MDLGNVNFEQELPETLQLLLEEQAQVNGGSDQSRCLPI